MKSVWVHAVLLALALPVAYLTWTRDPDEVAKRGAMLLWNASADEVAAVEVHNRVQDFRLDPRSDDGNYIWGTRTYRITTAEDSVTYAQLVMMRDSIGFMVGDVEGKEVMSLAAAPVAIRELGMAYDSVKKEFGFGPDTTVVRVTLADGVQEMVIGGMVFGGEDRYVIRNPDRTVFVVPGASLATLLGGDLSLTDRRFHSYAKDSIASLEITTPKGSKKWAAVGQIGSTVQYAPPDSLDQVDIAFSNMMGQMDDNGITGYRPDVDPATVTRILRADYTRADGSAIGFLELFTRPKPDGTPEYFLRTEHTRVIVQTYPEIAQMLENNIDRLWGGN